MTSLGEASRGFSAASVLRITNLAEKHSCDWKGRKSLHRRACARTRATQTFRRKHALAVPPPAEMKETRDKDGRHTLFIADRNERACMVSWYRHGAARLTDPKHAFVHFSFTLLIFVSTNTRLDILFIPTPPPLLSPTFSSPVHAESDSRTRHFRGKRGGGSKHNSGMRKARTFLRGRTNGRLDRVWRVTRSDFYTLSLIPPSKHFSFPQLSSPLGLNRRRSVKSRLPRKDILGERQFLTRWERFACSRYAILFCVWYGWCLGTFWANSCFHEGSFQKEHSGRRGRKNQ